MAHVQEMLAGRYEVLDVLGRGGVAVVYRGRDRTLMRTVAIKVPAVDRTDDPSFVARFEREALAAAALSHPNIVAIYDSGRDGDTRFIVMEYLRGSSLAEVNRGRGPLPPREAVEIASQLADAMAAAHRAGVIHRDIKPANVMIDETGTAKVLDFGIARAQANSSLTRTAMVLGSARPLRDAHRPTTVYRRAARGGHAPAQRRDAPTPRCAEPRRADAARGARDADARKAPERAAA